MAIDEEDWRRRVDEAWALADALSEDELVGRIDRLADELGEGSAVGDFERAGARDSTGHSDLAVPLYRRALERGLEGERRRQAVIQLASSLRNMGEAQESVELLSDELKRESDGLDDAVRGFLALALVDVGREREAASLALEALAPHLPRYQRSLGTIRSRCWTPARLKPCLRS
jgi:tetratricopeptide (TPR) repeat protein